MEEEPTYDSSYETVFSSVFRNAGGSKPAPENLRIKATLEAINSVIDDQGGKRIPTAYFGILLTSLTDGRMKDEDARVASFALLSLVMPHVPLAVLKSRQPEIANNLVKLYNENYKTESKSLLKSLIHCITKMITIQDIASITKPEISQLFQLLVTLTVDSRPKVRHTAHEAIQEIFVTCVEGVRNALSTVLAAFVVKTVQKKTKDNQDLLHILGLLKSTIYLLSPNGVSTIFEALYTLVVSSTNNYIPALVMQCLESLFTPPDSDEQTVEEYLSKFPPSFYVQLVSALYDIQPSLTEAAPTTSFTQLLTKAILRLNKVNAEAGAKELPKYFKLMMNNFSTDRPEVRNSTFQNLREVISQCISENSVKEALIASKKSENRSVKTSVEQIIEILEVGLKYTYKESWATIFELYTIMFQTLGTASYPLLANTLASLGELHDSDFHSAQFSQALKNAIGTAITAMGPEKFLTVLPLNLSEGLNLQHSRDWILVMMKHYIKDAPMQYFNDYFLQLANQLMQKANKVFAEGKQVEAKNHQILYYQIWDLFPCFSDYPSDIVQGFKSIAKTLGTSLTNDSKLRKVICTGLTKMIEKSRVLGNTNEGKASVAALATFSKNFLPIFFNIYGPSAPEDRPSILAATESYVAITEQGVSNNFFKNIVQKLLESTTKKEGEMQVEKEAAKTPNDQQIYLTELTIPFIKCLSQDNVKFLYKVVKPLAKEGEDAHLQKKAFKVLRKIIESHPKWVNQNLKDLENFLIETLACPAPVKKVRLACIKQVILQLDVKEYPKFIPSVLGDIIIGTKDSGAKSRDIAEDTLKIIGNTLSQNNNTREFFVMLVAGLAGQTTLMISSTLIILGKMLKEFSTQVDDALVTDILKPVIYFINSHNREVVRGVLDFIRSALAAISKEVFEPHLKDLLTGIAGLPGDAKHAYRVPISFIFERLIKKFGYDQVAALLPSDDQKLLNYVRKALRRRERKKQNKRSEGGSKRNKNEDDVLESSDEEPENEDERQKMLDAADDETQIVEHGDEPLDFMDPKSVKQMLTSRPKLKGKRTLKDKFQMKDGKLLLPDISNEMDDSGPVEEEDMMDTGASAKSKRKGRDRDDFEDSDDESNKVQKKNQSSSQAHRKQKQQEKKSKHTGQEYQSKKAKGDMLKPGQHEPYAYIPLNPKMANKRRQHKAVGQFKNIVNAAKKGAQATKSKKGGNKRQ